MFKIPRSLLIRLLIMVALIATTVSYSLSPATAQIGAWCGDVCVRTDEGLPGCLVGSAPSNRGCRLMATRCYSIICHSDPNPPPYAE
jgi:hypothetical protein